MQGHVSSKTERVCFNVFWSKYESGCSNSNGLVQEECDDVQCADQAETLSCRIVADMGGSRAPMFSHVEENVDACLNRSGCYQLRLKVRDRFPSYCILLVVQDEGDLGAVLETFNWSVGSEESISNKEDKVHEGP